MKGTNMHIGKLTSSINTYECECNSLNLEPSLIPNNLLHMLDAETRMKMLKNRIDFYIVFRAEKNTNGFVHSWFSKFLDLAEIKKISGMASISLESTGYNIAASLMFSEREDYDKILNFLTIKKLAGEVR